MFLKINGQTILNVVYIIAITLLGFGFHKNGHRKHYQAHIHEQK